MKLPIINKPGYEVSYNNDDFVYNKYSVVKRFTIGDVRYVVMSTLGNQYITVVKKTLAGATSIQITREFLKFSKFDFIIKQIADL